MLGQSGSRFFQQVTVLIFSLYAPVRYFRSDDLPRFGYDLEIRRSMAVKPDRWRNDNLSRALTFPGRPPTVTAVADNIAGRSRHGG
jgi:hypothetical protein